MNKIVAAILCFSTFQVNAITNIESQRLNPPKEGISGHLEIKSEGRSGNSEQEFYGFSGRINHLKNKHLVFFIASKEYGESNDVKVTDKSFIHGRWVYGLRNKLATEAFLQYQDNEFTRLLSRYLGGGGVRYQAVQDTDLNLALGAGMFYVNEREELITYQTNRAYLRFNTYASYKHQLNDNVSLISTAYFQPRTSELSDYHVLVNSSLISKLSERLKLKLAANVSHDSDPPRNLDAVPVIDVETTDIEYSVAFIYEF